VRSIFASNRNGHTLVEVSIAAAILVMAVALAMRGLLYVMVEAKMADTQSELDIEVQISMERVKSDLRLTALERVLAYPGGAGPYSAISFPRARDDDGDGAVDLDVEGNIDWDETLVYHVWPSAPHQLRLTIFDPRNHDLSVTGRLEQLESVVLNGHGNNTYNGSNATTRVVFENLFEWSVSPRGARFDAYASNLCRAAQAPLGSCIIDAGAHDFKFEVIDVNPASSGRKIGLDSFVVSPCAAWREAERQLPVEDESGATAADQYMAGGSWDGNYQLAFASSSDGHYVTLSLENDRWEESNFGGIGAQQDNTTVEFDQSLATPEYVVKLEGLDFNWEASRQTADTNYASSAEDEIQGCAVRVVLRGEEMENGAWIRYDGGRCWVNFRGGDELAKKLRILKAYIGECVSATNASMDVAAGTQHALTFGGSDAVEISGGSSRWSDLASFSIDREKTYLVSFLVRNQPTDGTCWRWEETQSSNAINSYVIPSSIGPGTADLAAETWSSRGDVVATNAVHAVQYLYTTYPTNGTFTSQVLDTNMDTPDYTDIDWHDQLDGGTIALKVRSGATNDLSDAPAWTNVSAMSSPGVIDPGDNRYIQFQAELKPHSSGLATPLLRDVIIRWPGPERLVDVFASVTKGPDYGVFELTVDGEPLRTGVVVDLDIFRDMRVHKGTQRLRSRLVSEVAPRNSGL